VENRKYVLSDTHLSISYVVMYKEIKILITECLNTYWGMQTKFKGIPLVCFIRINNELLSIYTQN